MDGELHRFAAHMGIAAIAAVFIAGVVALVVDDGIGIFFVTFAIGIGVAPTIWVRLVRASETPEARRMEFRLRLLALLWAFAVGLLIGFAGNAFD